MASKKRPAKPPAPRPRRLPGPVSGADPTPEAKARPTPRTNARGERQVLYHLPPQLALDVRIAALRLGTTASAIAAEALQTWLDARRDELA